MLISSIILFALLFISFSIQQTKNFYLDAEEAKALTLEACPLSKDHIAGMYERAKWLCDVIDSAKTYKEYCNAEDQLNEFAEMYRDCEGFAEVALDLTGLLEISRKVVRRRDKVAPFDVRYSPE